MHQIKRVIRIDVPEPFTFPLKDRKEMIRRGEITDVAEEEVESVLEVQDAVEGVAPNPKAETLEKSDTTLPKGPVARGSGARAVWNQGWLAFIGSGISDGWCDYAECKVKYSPCEGKSTPNNTPIGPLFCIRMKSHGMSWSQMHSYIHGTGQWTGC